MSTFFPEGFDPRSSAIGLLGLVNINTEEGDFGFILGADGVFTDVNGKNWYGSQLFEVSSLKSAIDGIAPSGEISMSFFQDPAQPELIQNILNLGNSYVKDRPITFYIQALRSLADLENPYYPPTQWLKRTMKMIKASADGDLLRSLNLSFEAWSEDRRSSRRIVLNTNGHKELLGVSNPSLEFMPTIDFEEQKLFG